jgi:hypothetical protein
MWVGGNNTTFIFSCPIFGGLLHLVRAWIGVSGVDPIDVSTHFFQFTNLLGDASTRRSFFAAYLASMCVGVMD